jgi:hypothetical protein
MKSDEVLTVTAGKVKEAAESCPTADGVLRKMFPEVFKEEWRDITRECNLEIVRSNLGVPGYWVKIYHAGRHIGWLTDSGHSVLPEYRIERVPDGTPTPCFRIEFKNAGK